MNSNLEFRDGSTQRWVRLADLSLGGTRNGLYKPKEFHGSGAKIVNMGELFAFPRLANEEMKRIEVTQDELDRFGLQAGDLLFARRSLVADGAGKCSIVVHCDAPTVFESSIIRLRPARERVEPEYLFYLFRSSVGDQLLDRIRKRDAVSGITGKDLAALEVPLPAKEVQRNVCDLLSTLDNRIDHNQALAANLEAIARRLFKSWFVDFDPVRAKAAGEKPSGLADDIAVLFPDRFVESELGEIPEGWRVETVGDLSDVVGGTTPRTKEPTYWNGGIHAWATPKDLSALLAPILLDTERQITDAGLSQISSGLLPKGTVLLSSRAPIGYLAIAEVPVSINQGFIAMKPKTGISNIFLLLWARVAREEIVSRANGSTFLEISKANFRPIPLIKPTAEVMQEFDQLARPLYEKVANCVRESRTLSQVRDLLLPRLISGKIRVSDAQAQIEESLA